MGAIYIQYIRNVSEEEVICFSVTTTLVRTTPSPRIINLTFSVKSVILYARGVL